MKTLTIIGNGFDLGHSIPTQFDSFIFSNPEVYPIKYNVFSTEEGSWNSVEAKFESHLRETMNKRSWQDVTEEVDRILGDYGLNEYGEVDFYGYSFEGYDEELDKIANFVVLLGEFEKDFSSYLGDTCNDDFLKTIAPKKAISKILKKSDCVITFNYTHTAEVLYGVKGAIHIHGDINDNIAIGSGALEDAKNSTIDYEYPTRKNFSPDKHGLVEMMRFYTEDMDGHLVEDHFIRRFFDEVSVRAEEKENELFDLLDVKNKDSLAERRDTIELLKSIHFDRVYIIGHSLNDADLAVLDAINRDAFVTYFYHKGEYVKREQTLKRLGFHFEMVSDEHIYH